MNSNTAAFIALSYFDRKLKVENYLKIILIELTVSSFSLLRLVLGDEWLWLFMLVELEFLLKNGMATLNRLGGVLLPNDSFLLFSLCLIESSFLTELSFFLSGVLVSFLNCLLDSFFMSSNLSCPKVALTLSSKICSWTRRTLLLNSNCCSYNADFWWSLGKTSFSSSRTWSLLFSSILEWTN